MDKSNDLKKIREDLHQINFCENYFSFIQRNNDKKTVNNFIETSKRYKECSNNNTVCSNDSKISSNNSSCSSSPSSRKRRNITSTNEYGNPLTSLSKNLLEVYKQCRPESFKCIKQYQIQRRILTKDSLPDNVNCFDNKQGDFILSVGDIISNPCTGQRFKVLDMLGQGTFGQVVKCRVLPSNHINRSRNGRAAKENGKDFPAPCPELPLNEEANTVTDRANSVTNSELPSMVAIKIVKNRPAYTSQAKVEVKILEKLVRACEKSNQSERHFHERIVQILDSFHFHSHMCMVFELMSINLYELIKQNGYRGFSVREVSSFTSQIVAAMKVLSDLKMVHCDLKPENILIENFSNPPRLKLADFGSACFENQTVFTYIQSRFYRAPEVIIGLPYSNGIDIWSLGCIIAELWMGLPVFPGVSNHNQLLRIEEMLGEIPDWMHEQGKQVRKFYKQHLISTSQEGDAILKDLSGFPITQPMDLSYKTHDNMDVASSTAHSTIPKHKWILKTPEEYARDENLTMPERFDRFCNFRNLGELIFRCGQNRRPVGESSYEIDKNVLKSLYHLLTGLLSLDPTKRFSIADVLVHPFVSSPTMTWAQSPVRRASSLIPSSPMLSSSSPIINGSNSPFSLPSRPLAPHPFAANYFHMQPISTISAESPNISSMSQYQTLSQFHNPELIRQSSLNNGDANCHSQANLMFRSSATSDLGPLSFQFSSLLSQANTAGGGIIPYSTGNQAATMCSSMNNLNFSKGPAPSQFIPSFGSISNQSCSQNNYMHQGTARPCGLRLVAKRSSSVGEDFNEYSASPLSLGAHASASLATSSFDNTFQTKRQNLMANGYEQSFGLEPISSCYRLIPGSRPRLSFNEQVILSSPNISADSCQRIRASSLSRMAVSHFSSPPKIQMRRSSAFSKFSLDPQYNSRLSSREVSPAISSPSLSKIYRSSSLTSNSSSDQVSISDFSTS